LDYLLYIFGIVMFRCERLASCVVSVSPETLGDSCPDTPKYLEVHYYCREDDHPAAVASRPSPLFPDTELTALWNQHGHKVNIDSVLQAVKERPPPPPEGSDNRSDDKIGADRVPITTVAAGEVTGDMTGTTSSAAPLTTLSTARTGPRIQFAVTEPMENATERLAGDRTDQADSDPDQNWMHNTTAQLRRQEERLELGDEEGGSYVEKEKEESGEEEEEAEKGRVNTMFVLEVVTYAVASVCGVIIVFLILKVSILSSSLS
jgi:hypothetical protein